MLYHFLRKLPVCGEGDILLLNRSVCSYFLYLFSYLLFSKQIYALF